MSSGSDTSGDDGSALEQALAVLRSTAPDAPRRLDPAAAAVAGAVEAWLAVALVRPRSEPDLADLPVFVETVGDGVQAMALPLPAARDGVGPDAAALRALVRALRRAWRPGTRVALVVTRGLVTDRAVLGPGPDLAAELFRADSVEGLWCDERARLVLGEPAVKHGPAWRLAVGRGASPRIGRLGLAGTVLAAAALAAALLGPALVNRPVAPDARVYVTLVRSAENRSRAAGKPVTARVGDVLNVTLQAAPGAHVTLGLLDSRNRLVVPATPERHLNTRRTEISERWALDDVAGWERPLAIVGRRPLDGLPELLEQVNAVPELTREQRIEHLRRALRARFGGGASLALGAEIEHAP